jgi:two-component system response regulator RegA
MASPSLPPLRCALVVEDNDALREALAATVRQLGAEVFEAATAGDAIARLSERTPDLVIADVCLPDGSAHALFDASRRLTPQPLEIGISGQASAEQAFLLAQLGVRAFLAKPFSLQELRNTIERVRTEAPPLEEVARASVGKLPLREATTRVRSAMVDEALAIAGGSRSGAARLLDVSRQAVQQAIADLPSPYRADGSADSVEAAPADPGDPASTSRTFS